VACIAVWLIGWSAAGHCSAEDKLALPTIDEQSAARRTIAEIYKSDYDKAKTPFERVALAKKLIEVGNDTKDDAAAQFVLWRIAKDIAVRAADYDLAVSAISKLNDRFSVDALSMKVEALESVAKASEAVQDYKTLAPAAASLLEDAINGERFDLADRACDKMLEFNQKLGDSNGITRAQSRQRGLAKIETAFKELAGALTLLQTQPTDSAANNSVGRFRCFIKNDWVKGLPMLARSGNEALVRISKEDLGNPEEPSSQVALADDWWNFADDEKDDAKAAIQIRAAYWYQKALPKLSGLAKEKAEKRAAGTRNSIPQQSVASEPTPAIQDSASKEETKPKSPAALAALVQREAQQCHSAKDALLVYKLFLANNSVPDEAKERVRKQLDSVDVAAAKDYVRLGMKWVSRDDARKAQQQAESLVKEAVDLLDAHNVKVAKESLEKASRIDPDGTRADFMLGVLFALNGRDYIDARSHLMECVRREPQNVCTLNNLAIVEIMLNEPLSAISHLREAKSVDPTAPELAHNVRKVLAECGLKRLNLSSDVESSFSELYGELARSAATEEKASRGWRYMPPIAATIDSDDEPNDSSNSPKGDAVPPGGDDQTPPSKKSRKSVPKKEPATGASVILSGGTGFVVYPHYVLTNRHVVADGRNIFVTDPADPTSKKELKATVIAQSQNPDLAIVRCDELAAPPAGINPHLPGRGTDIMVLGFPEFFDIGTGLKSTRGSLVGLPSDDTDGMCLYDATTNHGNSGGPVCDNTGRVIAVVRVGYNFMGKLGGGIPSEQVVTFLHEHIPDFHPIENGEKALAWPEVDALVSKSTVLILCRVPRDQLSIPGGDDLAFQSSSRSAANKSTKRASGSVTSQPTYIEDDGCVACKGTGRVRCPDCQNGTIAKIEKVLAFGDAGTGVQVYTDKHVRVPCKRCDGTGQIECPVCHGSGREP